MDLPTLLRTQRASRRWPQNRAATALGMTFYRYRQIEGGERPTDGEAEAIGQVFGLTPRAVRRAMNAGAGEGSGEAASVA